MNSFTQEILGCKVNISNRGGTERFVGLVSKILEDDYGVYLKLIPFAETDKFKEAMTEKFPDVTVESTPVTIIKRLSSIDTFIILEKPDNLLNGSKNKSTKDSED